MDNIHEQLEHLIEKLVKDTWAWGESCGVDKLLNQILRETAEKTKDKLYSFFLTAANLPLLNSEPLYIIDTFETAMRKHGSVSNEHVRAILNLVREVAEKRFENSPNLLKDSIKLKTTTDLQNSDALKEGIDILIKAIKETPHIMVAPWIAFFKTAYELSQKSDLAGITRACQCRACVNPEELHVRMIVCSICGNKRCPHATNHRLVCTNSNESGQWGSVY